MVLAFQSTGMVRGVLMDWVACNISLNCRVVCGVAVDQIAQWLAFMNIFII